MSWFIISSFFFFLEAGRRQYGWNNGRAVSESSCLDTGIDIICKQANSRVWNNALKSMQTQSGTHLDNAAQQPIHISILTNALFKQWVQEMNTSNTNELCRKDMFLNHIYIFGLISYSWYLCFSSKSSVFCWTILLFVFFLFFFFWLHCVETRQIIRDWEAALW